MTEHILSLKGKKKALRLAWTPRLRVFWLGHWRSDIASSIAVLQQCGLLIYLSWLDSDTVHTQFSLSVWVKNAFLSHPEVCDSVRLSPSVALKLGLDEPCCGQTEHTGKQVTSNWTGSVSRLVCSSDRNNIRVNLHGKITIWFGKHVQRDSVRQTSANSQKLKNCYPVPFQAAILDPSQTSE